MHRAIGRGLCQLTLVGAVLLPASAASAATVVTGHDTPNGPLVIEPDTGARYDSNSGSSTLFFIQKMPATKTINRVTLGDLALSSTCTSTSPVLGLSIREHPTGAIGSETSIGTWEGEPLAKIPADQQFARRTWRTEPITLTKGRAYSFRVESTVSGCLSVQIRSWAHNHSKVNVGASRCDRVTSSTYRMWHDTDASDVTVCGSQNSLPNNFDPTMPRGWLSVYTYGSGNLIEIERTNGSSAPTGCLGADYGARAVPWRPWSGHPGWTEYVCVFTEAESQYPDYIDPSSPFFPNDPPDGWYYGFGWNANKPGGPRDMYLKLDVDRAELAAWYKPYLLFDTDEKWRPLNLDHFFDERDSTTQPMHRRCQPGPAPAGADPDDIDPSGGGTEAAYCPRIGTPAEVMLRDTDDAYLKINGFDADDSGEFRSPNGACNVDGLYDCNGGLISSLYYYVSEPLFESQYRYVSYWAFYRWNTFGSFGQHEGDWEGMAVAPSRERPATFDYASFSSHGPWFSYLRDTLTCADNLFGSPKLCGTEADKAYSHIRTYVAEGSHANYPRACASTCNRAGGPFYAGETDYDGARGWGHNSSATGLQPNGLVPMPPPSSGTWVDWRGRWGDEGSPASPGRQPEFYDPWSGCGYGQECALPAAAQRRPAVSSCDDWFGPHIAAVACDAAGLRRSVRNATLGRRGRLVLKVRRAAASAAHARGQRPARASTPPLSQLLAAPLGPGDRLVLRGRASRSTQLMVRYRVGERIRIARFHQLGLARSGRATVRVKGSGRTVRAVLSREAASERSALPKMVVLRAIDPKTDKPDESVDIPVAKLPRQRNAAR